MSLPAFAATRRVTVAMATLTVVLFGAIAATELKVTLLPELSYPTLTIRTEYTGAAPAEIENLVTEPIEEVVGTVKDLKTLNSVSRAGQSDVLLEFAWGTNMDNAAMEVREKLELLQLPLEVGRPQLLRFDPSTDPIMRLALSQGDANAVLDAQALKALRRYADDELRRLLEPVSGVAAVKIGGGLEDEIQIEIDQERLAQAGLTVTAISDRLREENVNLAAGRLNDGPQRYLVRTINQFTDLEQIEQLLLRARDGTTLRLRDVATVRAGARERDAVIRVNAAEAVEIAVYKEGDANTVAVADGVQRVLKRITDSSNALPPGMNLTVIDDQSTFIRAALDEVRNNALLGGLLAVLVIHLFLRRLWLTFVIALSLPVALIGSFFVLNVLGLSLNMMSLGGLALATGMVVDGAIVVLENIERRLQEGFGPLEAAVRGASEVGLAVSASVLTTVAVFLPLVFVEGIAGQLFRDQAITVSVAMLLSLVVALTLIPMLASLATRAPLGFPDEPSEEREPSRWQRWMLLPLQLLGGVGHGLLRLVLLLLTVVWRLIDLALAPLAWAVERLMLAADRLLIALLPWSLRHRALIVLLALASLAAALMTARTLGMDLIPPLAQSRFEAFVRLPPGTPLADTDRVGVLLREALADDPRIETVFAVSGSGTRLDANPTESGENIARVLITLAPGYTDAASEAQAQAATRQALEQFVDADSQVERPQLFSFATPLEIVLRGYELGALRNAADRVSEALRANPRFADVRSSVERGYPEVQVRFDQERAAQLGLTPRQIAEQVVRKIRGDVATRFALRERKIDVLIRAREADRASVDAISALIINPGSERPLPLSAVAEITVNDGPSEIRRRDQERVALISANLTAGSLGEAADEVASLLRELRIPAGVDSAIGGQSEELAASISSMLFALGLAVFLVYLVMASQFESLKHPLVILFTIPLALVGSIVALKIFGLAISVIASIGIVLLAGIVVNNGIVLIDRINQNRIAGMDLDPAILEAARVRLRPIAMTTLTTLVGFLPLALGLGEGSEIRQPMAITVIGGLSLSTVLALIVIPVLYRLMESKSRPSAEAGAAR